MAQTTSGLRRLLNHPAIYRALQQMLMSDAKTAHWVNTCVRPTATMRILDIGCGPGDLVRFMPATTAFEGFDLSQDYIDEANRLYGDRARFSCARVDGAVLSSLEKFDVVIARGVLHHLDDGEAHALFGLAKQALRPGGRVVTLDACYAPGQSVFAKALIDRDRGQSVRDEGGYRGLAASVFDDVNTEVRHDLMRVPYTHCLLEAVAR
jgi:SAM-dependent methyltransferase